MVGAVTRLSTADADDPLRAERVARAEMRAARNRLRAAEFDAGVRRRSWRDGTIVPIVLCVAAVAGCAFAVSVWVRASATYSDADYEQAAAQHVALLLSPDFRSPGVARRILDGSTGDFHDEFAQSADSYTQYVRSRGTVIQARVTGTGVSGRTGDTAAVLVSASARTATGADAPQPGSAQTSSEDSGTSLSDRVFRLRVLVTPVDGDLKLSAVQYLP